MSVDCNSWWVWTQDLLAVRVAFFLQGKNLTSYKVFKKMLLLHTYCMNNIYCMTVLIVSFIKMCPKLKTVP